MRQQVRSHRQRVVRVRGREVRRRFFKIASSSACSANWRLSLAFSAASWRSASPLPSSALPCRASRRSARHEARAAAPPRPCPPARPEPMPLSEIPPNAADGPVVYSLNRVSIMGGQAHFSLILLPFTLNFPQPSSPSPQRIASHADPPPHRVALPAVPIPEPARRDRCDGARCGARAVAGRCCPARRC